MSQSPIVPSRPSAFGTLGWVMFSLAAAGLALSTLSLVNHYKTSPTEYCDIGDNFNCDLVNRSDFSELNIAVSGALTGKTKLPVAGIGMAGYVVLMAFSRFARNRNAARVMFLAALAGWAFALRLTYIEKYVLGVWCLLCLGSFAVITILTILAAWQTMRASKTIV
jgi:uncharacterized membrane protein